MVSTWLVVVAWMSLVMAAVSFVVIVVDIFVTGHRQPMPIMAAVWPITALYGGPIAVWGYVKFGRVNSKKWLAEHGRDEPPPQPPWVSTATGVSHCGAGCTLADIAVAWLVFVVGFEVAGRALPVEIAGEYVAALLFGIAFQYFAIAPMRGLGVRAGLVAAAKADVLSLTAFQVGMFGWMILTSLVLFIPPLHPDSPVYWFMMQIGMVVGFATSWPANVWLIKRGIKEAM